MSEQRKKLRLGELLIQQGLVTPDQLGIALAEQKQNNIPIGRQLVRLGFITEAAIRDIMARTVGQESIDLAQVVADPEALKLVPQDFARRHRVLPIAYNTEERQLTIATTEIFNVVALDQLRANPKVDGSKRAAIGFSNGGYFAVWLAAAGKVRAGISYYGALSGAGSDREQVRFREVINDRSSPILILHGRADSTVPISQAAQLDRILTAAKVPHEYVNYDGAAHVFERTSGKDNEAAAADAWTRTLAFLKNNLK